MTTQSPQGRLFIGRDELSGATHRIPQFNSVLLVLFLAMMLGGCALTREDEVAVGESADITRYFGFVFPKGEQYLTVAPNQQVKALVFNEAAWRIPPGVVLEHPKLDLMNGETEWSISGGKASVEGIFVVVSCRL